VKAGILERILPYTEQWRTLGRLPAEPILRLAVLAAEPAGLKERLRLSNLEAQRIEDMTTAAPVTPLLRPRERRSILYHMGVQGWRDIVHLSWAKSRASLDDAAWRKLLGFADRWEIPSMPVNGRDLIAGGMKAGPELGDVLRKLEDWWVAADFKPDRAELLARLEK
jgi:poly(A) polymerase